MSKAALAKPSHAMQLNKLIVSAYKVMGFAILTTILVGLSSYLVINVFYLINRSWVAPTIISPVDERVIQLSAQLAQESSLRDKLFADRLDMMARLEDANRIVATEEAFQASFALAMQADLADRRSELSKFSGLIGQYNTTQREVLKSNDAYTGMSRGRMQELFGAHIIDQDGFINGNYQLAQIAHSNLNLAEKNVEIDTRISQLRRDVKSLELASLAVNGDPAKMKDQQLSYEILRIKHEFDKSVLEAKKAQDSRDGYKQSVIAIDNTIGRFDRVLKNIQESPYMKAAEHNLTVAFVPYDNIASVEKGEPVYGCKLGILWCSKVGQVADILDGEVLGKHPLHNQEIRGVFVQVQLEDAKWAEETVLHVGRAPLLL
jgi:hypothetical protein